MSIRVFVSYSNDDQKHLERLITEVERTPDRPAIVWLTDCAYLRGGDRVDAKIRSMINTADIWILLFTPRFRDSDYCIAAELPLIRQTNEVRCRQGKRPGLRPILLEDYGESDEMDLLKDGLQRVSVIAHDSPILEEGNLVDERWGLAATAFVASLRELAIERGLVQRTELSEFWGEMQRGQLTPFLGPSCSETRENYEPALPHLHFRLQQLLTVLAAPADHDARQYALAVAKSRKLELSNDDAGKDIVALPDEFLQMQGTIARLGAASCAIFADALGRAHQGMTDTRAYAVALNEVEPALVDDLAKATLDAAVAAGAVKETVGRNPHSPIAKLSLSADRIQVKLVTLASMVFGADGWAAPIEPERLNAWPALFRRRLEEPGALRASGRMALSHLEWVGDLLWHTIRFDVPLFPSPDDFAFQLAMCSASPHSVARMDLGLAALVGRDEFLVEAIVTHFDRLARRPYSANAAESLPGALGQLLRLGFDHELARGPRTEGSEASAHRAVKKEEMRSEEGSQPLLLTATMDRDVEYSLEQVGGPYLTLFPVSYSELKEANATPDRLGPQQTARGQLKPAWLLAAFKCPGARNPEFFYVDPEVRFGQVVKHVRTALNFGGSRSKILPGPIIVHLRGAPLVRLPNEYTEDFDQILLHPPASNRLGRVKFAHRILLSPMDYSRELSGLQSPPRCLRDLMGEDRVLLFLGHALGEPGGFSGLQTDVWLSRDKEGSGSGQVTAGERVSADGHSLDEVQATVLANMGITALKITLDDVGRELGQILRAHT